MQNTSSARNDSARSLAHGGEQRFNLTEWQGAVKEKRSIQSDAVSMASTQPNGQGNGLLSNGNMSNGVADFFSPEIFQNVLHNPTTSHQLLQFSQSRFCGENMEFLEKVGPSGDHLPTIQSGY